MIMIALMLAVLAAEDTDLVLKGAQAPESYGGAARMTCGRLMVEIEYDNSGERGLRRLTGQMAFSGESRSLADHLQGIKGRSRGITDVEQSCGIENEVITSIYAGTSDGDSQEWVLTVREDFNVQLRGPFLRDSNTL